MRGTRSQSALSTIKLESPQYKRHPSLDWDYLPQRLQANQSNSCFGVERTFFKHFMRQISKFFVLIRRYTDLDPERINIVKFAANNFMK